MYSASLPQQGSARLAVLIARSGRAVPAPATTRLQTFALQVQQRPRETRGAQRPYGNVSSPAGGAVRCTPQVASTRSTQPPGALALQPQASRRAAFVRVCNLCSPSEFKSLGCPSYLASLRQPGRWHRERLRRNAHSAPPAHTRAAPCSTQVENYISLRCSSSQGRSAPVLTNTAAIMTGASSCMFSHWRAGPCSSSAFATLPCNSASSPR